MKKTSFQPPWESWLKSSKLIELFEKKEAFRKWALAWCETLHEGGMSSLDVIYCLPQMLHSSDSVQACLDDFDQDVTKRENLLHWYAIHIYIWAIKNNQFEAVSS